MFDIKHNFISNTLRILCVCFTNNNIHINRSPAIYRISKTIFSWKPSYHTTFSIKVVLSPVKVENWLDCRKAQHSSKHSWEAKCLILLWVTPRINNIYASYSTISVQIIILNIKIWNRPFLGHYYSSYIVLFL